MRGGAGGESFEARLRLLEQTVLVLQRDLVAARDTIAKLRLGRGELLVQTQGGISVGSTGTCTVMSYDADADADVDSGEEIDVRLKIGTPITVSATAGIARWFPGWNEWWFVATECD